MSKLAPGMRYPMDTSGLGAALPAHGFGDLEVPDMPAYVQSYSKRGNTFDAETTPVYSQARFGNRNGRGGMSAYLSGAEDPTYMEGYRTKLGDQGVYEQVRWTPGYDWRGGFGVASLDASKNFAMSTRGGQLRKGGPRRSDIVDRPNYWSETVRPGISHSRYTQKNENYSGVFETSRRTPEIERANDTLVLREMIEHNPFHIGSHAAAWAKRDYDGEFGAGADAALPAAYATHISPNEPAPSALVFDDDPHMRYLSVLRADGH
jgi:hypothetical protein